MAECVRSRNNRQKMTNTSTLELSPEDRCIQRVIRSLHLTKYLVAGRLQDISYFCELDQSSHSHTHRFKAKETITFSIFRTEFPEVGKSDYEA